MAPLGPLPEIVSKQISFSCLRAGADGLELAHGGDLVERRLSAASRSSQARKRASAAPSRT